MSFQSNRANSAGVLPTPSSSVFTTGVSVGLLGGFVISQIINLVLKFTRFHLFKSDTNNNSSSKTNAPRQGSTEVAKNEGLDYRPLDNLHHLDMSRVRMNNNFRHRKAYSHSRSDIDDSQGTDTEVEFNEAELDAISSISPENVFQVVVTGGPCAGKSSAIEYFSSRLRKLGYEVYQVPEVPTLLMNGGCYYPGLNGGNKLIQFEVSLVELQLQMEQSFYNIATKASFNFNAYSSSESEHRLSSKRGSVILYDRGLLDVAAFVPRSMWERIVNHSDWVRDGLLGVIDRYDLIIHLVSAANGAEKFYKIKRESLNEARDLDQKIISCYRGHEKHVVVDNSTDFEAKLHRAFKHVLQMLEIEDE